MLLEAKQAAEAETLRRLAEEEEREAALRREKQHLEESAKAEAVRRQRRKEEYEHVRLLASIEDRNARAAGIMQERNETIKVRLYCRLCGECACANASRADDTFMVARRPATTPPCDLEPCRSGGSWLPRRRCSATPS
jgi:hypothetical protein